MKFYRLEARRILAGPKKMSTIVITASAVVVLLRSGKRFDTQKGGENGRGARLLGGMNCGKAEEGSG